jgi:thiamine biosynthesis lipoprotein
MVILSGQTMGTTYAVKIVIPTEQAMNAQGISDRIESRLLAINRAMSTYVADSELSRFNTAETVEPVEVSKGLRFVLTHALEISAATQGAFDPTVGPLVNAWGFGPEKRGGTPSEETLATLKTRVGYQKVTVQDAKGTIRKSQGDVYIDLSAIAKGYGVDEIASLLNEAGMQDYLVEIGGELRGKGLNRRRMPWRLAVERPKAGPGEVHKNAVIALGTGAMATSGDYRNYYELEGKRVSHTLDPRSGQPIEHMLASVTVVAPTCIKADGWATALNVLGAVEGLKIANAMELSAFFLVREADGAFSERSTAGFDRLRNAAKIGISGDKPDKVDP